jgi:hypothetical protein
VSRAGEDAPLRPGHERRGRAQIIRVFHIEQLFEPEEPFGRVRDHDDPGGMFSTP